MITDRKKRRLVS